MRRAEPASVADASDSERLPRAAPRRPSPEDINFSNLKKIFWPAERYTKGDLIDYYRAVSPWLLPYLRTGRWC